MYDTSLAVIPSSSRSAQIAQNLSRLHEEIAQACRRSGRDVQAVRKIAVSKFQPPEDVLAAICAGQQDFGENRVQEACSKIAWLEAHRAALEMETPPSNAVETPAEAWRTQPVYWHLIGGLQTNKARLVPPHFAWMHTLDSLRTAQALQRHAEHRQSELRLLIQLNWHGEASKSGVRDADALYALVAQSLACPNLRLCGLMSLPPPNLDERESRAHFAAVRGALEALRVRFPVGAACCELSMGMSRDFVWAVEEGSTMVRIGTALFGSRTP